MRNREATSLGACVNFAVVQPFPMVHTPTLRQRETHASFFFAHVCALHNAGVKVSGLIFYLSGLITSAFTAALLRSVEDTPSLLNLYRERKKKLHVYNLYRGATDATAADAPSIQGVLQHPASV